MEIKLNAETTAKRNLIVKEKQTEHLYYYYSY